MRSVALGIVSVGLAAVAPTQGQPTDRTDALHVLQGAGGSVRLEPERIAGVARWIGAIREAHPAVAGIHASPRHELGVALLYFTPEVEKRVRPKPETGVEELDELQAELGARLDRQGPPGHGGLWIARFPAELDVPAVCRRYRELAAVKAAEPNGYSGDGDEIVLLERGGRLLFVFKHGWGDCPAGCTHNHYWYFEVDPAAETITARGELRDADAGTARIHRWAIPARFPATVFADADAVLRALGDDEWWVALHAVEVTGRLLAGSTSPWVGEDFDDVVRFERVRDGIAERPVDAYRALITALESEDPGVREASLRWLRRLSGLEHGADADGVRAWRAWLDGK